MTMLVNARHTDESNICMLSLLIARTANRLIDSRNILILNYASRIFDLLLLLQKWRRWSARQSLDRKPDGRRAQHSLGGNLVAVPRKTEIAEQILSAAREVQKKANKIAFFFFKE